MSASMMSENSFFFHQFVSYGQNGNFKSFFWEIVGNSISVRRLFCSAKPDYLCDNLFQVQPNVSRFNISKPLQKNSAIHLDDGK